MTSVLALSRAWVWPVLALVVAGVGLLGRAVAGALAESPQALAAIRTAWQRSWRPAATTGVALAWTVAYALYALSLPTLGPVVRVRVPEVAAPAATTPGAPPTTRAALVPWSPLLPGAPVVGPGATPAEGPPRATPDAPLVPGCSLEAAGDAVAEVQVAVEQLTGRPLGADMALVVEALAGCGDPENAALSLLGPVNQLLNAAGIPVLALPATPDLEVPRVPEALAAPLRPAVFEACGQLTPQLLTVAAVAPVARISSEDALPRAALRQRGVQRVRAGVVVVIETRSDRWVAIVLVGLAVTATLGVVSVRAFARALPSDLRVDLRRTLARHRPSVGGGIVLLAAAVVLTVLQLPAAVSERVSVRTPGAAADLAAGADTTGSAEAAGGAAGGAPTGGPASSPTTRSTVPLAPVAAVDLFDEAHDRIGITDDAIRICGHAPLSLGAVLNTKVEDLLVYWRWRNDRGGIHGRRVDVSLEDDQYSASGGVPAAQRCAERDPFLLFGSVGSDVTPPVREWAEQQKMLYLYGFSARAGSEDLRYSYTASILQEDLARILADIATTRYTGERIGLLWRNSSNVQPGRDAFRRQAEAYGGEIVADLPVQQSQGNYTQEIIELQEAGVEVVVILDDALAQTNMMLQASSQGYRPHWVVFAFNLQTDTLGDAALDPPLSGTNAAPAYTHGEYGGPFASYAVRGARVRGGLREVLARHGPLGVGGGHRLADLGRLLLVGQAAGGVRAGLQSQPLRRDARGRLPHRAGRHLPARLPGRRPPRWRVRRPVRDLSPGRRLGGVAHLPALCEAALMGPSLVVGLIAGTIYGLYALGLVLVFKGSGVLHFAHAEVGTLTLLVAHVLIVDHGLPYGVGAGAAILLAIAIGVAFERLAVWPLRSAPRVQVAVATLALLSLLITLELKVFGSHARLLDPPIQGDGIRILDVRVSPTQLLSVLLVAVIGGALALFLRRTDFGLSVVAAAQDPDAVRFLGIRLSRVSMFTWGLAAALSATAALLIQPTIGVISPGAYQSLFVKALAAALIGGLTSMSGAFVGGLLVGVAEAEIRHATVSSTLTGLPELAMFAALVLVLLLRPNGLLRRAATGAAA